MVDPRAGAAGAGKDPPMKKSVVTAALAGTIAVTGAAFAVPALAEGTTTTAPATTIAPATTAAATTTPSPSATDGSSAARPSAQARITEALAGLVTDGTITQAQADEVATTLAEQLPRGGHDGWDHDGWDHDGFGRAAFGQVATAAADALGVSQADLVTELRGGRSVADVAEEKGVDLDTVTTAVSDAVRTQIARAVGDGRITQARADAIEADLDAEITEELTEVHDGHHGGRDGRDGPFGGPEDPGSTAAPTS